MPDLNNKAVPVVLVVDASVDTLNAQALVLQQQGYSVLTAGNGKDALRQLESTRVDLVIVDHYTMEHDGLHLAATIKQIRPRTPVLMLSSAFQVESLPPGVDLVLSKVEPPTRVMDAVASLLSKSH